MAAIALYTDGGCIGPNPSPIGCTWAWCSVDPAGHQVATASGVLPATPDVRGTNNVAEYYAVLLALEAQPNGWSGTLYSDSAVTLGRVFQGHATAGIPAAWLTRAATALARLGPVTGVLLKGHPTKKDLAAKKSLRTGRPVSPHNKWCDHACRVAGRIYSSERVAR